MDSCLLTFVPWQKLEMNNPKNRPGTHGGAYGLKHDVD